MQAHRYAKLEVTGFMTGALGGLFGTLVFIGLVRVLVPLYPVVPDAIFPDFRPHLAALALTSLLFGPLAALGTATGIGRAVGDRTLLRPKPFLLLCLAWVFILPGSIVLGVYLVEPTSYAWLLALVPIVCCGLAMIIAANIKRYS